MKKAKISLYVLALLWALLVFSAGDVRGNPGMAVFIALIPLALLGLFLNKKTRRIMRYFLALLWLILIFSAGGLKESPGVVGLLGLAPLAILIAAGGLAGKKQAVADACRQHERPRAGTARPAPAGHKTAGKPVPAPPTGDARSAHEESTPDAADRVPHDPADYQSSVPLLEQADFQTLLAVSKGIATRSNQQLLTPLHLACGLLIVGPDLEDAAFTVSDHYRQIIEGLAATAGMNLQVDANIASQQKMRLDPALKKLLGDHVNATVPDLALALLAAYLIHP